MSGEMDPEALVSLREGIADNNGIRCPILVPIPLAAELLADRDYHKARADELARDGSGLTRFEADKLLADLDEARAKNAALREMERERNAFQHAFNLLATRVTNTIRPSDTEGQRDDTLEICKQVIARLRKGHAFATELAAMARVYEKKAP